MNNLTTLEQEIFAKFSQLESKESLEKLKIEILGKKALFQNCSRTWQLLIRRKKKNLPPS